MNIEVAEKTQQSIASNVHPFDMGSWTTCIAAHVLWATGSDLNKREFHNVEELEISRLGLSPQEAQTLFRGECGRTEAIGRLQSRIDDERLRWPHAEPTPAQPQATEPGPTLVTEPEPDLVAV